MRVLFMGTPDFALFSLRALVEAGVEIVGVLTQPDKPRGRGHELQPPPVKAYAVAQGLPVFQPATLRDGAFEKELGRLDPDVIVVVAYGKILPPYILNYPRYGCVNVHGSLLPAYRGAAPMQRAVIDGATEVGVTTMLMNEGLDTGDMLERAALPLGENDNFEAVHDALGALGAKLLLSTLAGLRAGTLSRTPQDHAAATYAAKITKADCLVDFSRSAKAVHDLVRGLSPVPLAFTHTPNGKLLKLLETRVVQGAGNAGAPGTVLSVDGEVTVACGEGTLAILRLLPEGKGRMSAAEFVRGRQLAVGDVLK